MPYMDAERRGDIPMISSDCEGIHPLSVFSFHSLIHYKPKLSCFLFLRVYLLSSLLLCHFLLMCFAVFQIFIHILDALTKSMNELLALIKLLREEIGHQRKEISYLRMLLENCAGCKEVKSETNIVRIVESCRSSNPCYAGTYQHNDIS